jgi:hypothetical protein
MDEQPKAAWFRVRALEGIVLALGATDARIKRLHAAEAERWLRPADLKPRTEAREGELPGGYVVRDANWQALAYLYSRDNPTEALQAKMLTPDEAGGSPSTWRDYRSCSGRRIATDAAGRFGQRAEIPRPCAASAEEASGAGRG